MKKFEGKLMKIEDAKVIADKVIGDFKKEESIANICKAAIILNEVSYEEVMETIEASITIAAYNMD